MPVRLEKKYTPEQQQQIINEYQAGAVLVDLAARYKYTPVTVLNFLKRKGVKTWGRIERIQGRRSQRQEWIKQLLLSKIATGNIFTLKQICAEVGLSEVCVRGHLRDLVRKKEIDQAKLQVCCKRLRFPTDGC